VALQPEEPGSEQRFEIVKAVVDEHGSGVVALHGRFSSSPPQLSALRILLRSKARGSARSAACLPQAGMTVHRTVI